MSLEQYIKEHPRMRDYMKPEDLNLDGCVALASEICRGLAQDLTQAVQTCAKHPNKANIEHVRSIQNVYRSDYFKAISCGLADGETVMREIARNALRGQKVSE